MAITIRSTSLYAPTGSVNPSIAANQVNTPPPTGLEVGDYYLIGVVFQSLLGSSAVDTPPGFTLLSERGTAANRAMFVYGKPITQPSDIPATTSITADTTAATRVVVIGLALAGVDLNTPMAGFGGWTLVSSNAANIPVSAATGPYPLSFVYSNSGGGSGQPVFSPVGGELVRQGTALASNTAGSSTALGVFTGPTTAVTLDPAAANGASFQIALNVLPEQEPVEELRHPAVVTQAGAYVPADIRSIAANGAHAQFSIPAYIPRPSTLDELLSTEPFYIAHRGSGDNWPEHTFRAYSKSISHGMKAIEVSANASSDGVLLCHHDKNTQRMTGESYAIASTLWSVLSTLTNTAAYTDDPTQSRPPIPLLADVLDAFAADHVIFLEDKGAVSTFPILDLADTYPDHLDHIVWKAWAGAGQYAEAKSRGYRTWGFFTSQADLDRLEDWGPRHDYLGVQFTLTDAQVQQVTAYGAAHNKPVISWEIHTPADRDRALSLGVVGMMTSNIKEVLRAPTLSRQLTLANPDNLWKPTKQVDQFVGANPELAPIAAQPQAEWIAESTTPATIQSFATDAAGKTMVLSIYAIPNRDLGSYSAGGFPDRASYLSWLTGIRDAIGTAPAIIVYEADALGHVDAMDAAARVERIETMRQAVTILSTLANTETYIDASQWIPAARQAELLQAVDVHKVAGFATNTSAYEAQESMYTYGNSVAAALAGIGISGRQFIVDSSRNGSGPLTDADRPVGDPWLDTSQAWCNPPGRLLGITPQAITGQGACRASLWVKSPGESDGTFPTLAESDYFGSSAPKAGDFWLPLARDLLGLAPVATSSGAPPATGTVSDVVANFDTGWGPFTSRSAEATLVAGKARVPLAASYPSISTAAAYRLAGGSVAARLYMATGAETTGGDDPNSTFFIQSATAGTRAAISLFPLNNQIRFGFETGYWDNGNVTLPYDPVAMAWVRIREAGGQSYMETSPDRAAWTIRRQIGTPAWAADATSSVTLSTYSDVAEGYAEMDNVNTP